MSNVQPPPGEPPEEDPFRKKPQEPQPPQEPQGPGPGQGPPAGSPYGQGQGGGSPYGGEGGAGGGGQPPPYGGGNAYGGPYGGADPLAGMPPLADFGKRFLARLIDVLIIAIPLGLLSWAAGGFDMATDGDSWDEITNQVNTGRQWLWSLISVVVYVGYDTFLTKRSGQTLGKSIMKLRVAMLNDGRTPDTSAALLRAAVLWVPALLCCFCVWWLVIIITVIADRPYRQGLHDKAAKTVVVSAA
ncbi:RDD family protein [Streptomyces sp. NBC_00390]|uniref:RDD family protein n=1 Tax=Streptomyces sp. NBC_00390 TaxID=2975736 RepID=UPI002E1A8D14